MSLEFDPTGLGRVAKRILHIEKPHEPSPGKNLKTYVGHINFSESGQWRLQEVFPVFPPNPEANVNYGNHFLDSDDYKGTHLIVRDPNNMERVLLDWQVGFYPDGVKDPKGKPYGFTHPIGVSEELLGLFASGCYPAEITMPIKPGSAIAGETAKVSSGILDRLGVSKPLVRALR